MHMTIVDLILTAVREVFPADVIMYQHSYDIWMVYYIS